MRSIYRVPGCAVGVTAESGQNVVAAGVGDVSTEAPVTAETRFRIASLTKVVTAWSALIAVHDGLLELDEPIAGLLRRWEVPGPPEWTPAVTLRRLLSHTAGLPSGSSPLFDEERDVPPLADVVAGKAGMPAAAPSQPPGEAFRYSNPGYGLVQLLIEDITGETFADWVQQRLLTPLGMSRSGFHQVPGSDAAPHHRSERLPEGVFNQQAAGGLRSTAGDLLALAAAMTPQHENGLGGGVLPATLVEEMWKTPEASKGTFGLRSGGYALGHIATTTPRGARLILNQGSTAGWRSLFACSPDTGRALIVLTNSTSGTLLLAHAGLRWIRRVERRPLAVVRMRQWR